MRPIHLLESQGLDLESTQLDRLKEELVATGMKVRRLPDTIDADGDDAFLVVLHPGGPSEWMLALPAPRHERVLERTVLFRCARAPMLFEVLEAHGVAGGLSHLDLWAWRDEKTGGWVTGRRDVLSTMDVSFNDEVFRSRRYQQFHVDEPSTIVRALAKYLAALDVALTPP